MSEVPFYRTQMGHRFFEHTMPELVRQLTRLNELLVRALDERAVKCAPSEIEEEHAEARP